MNARSWENPPRQEPDSMDCSFFSASYIARALGHPCEWSDVKTWHAQTRLHTSQYAWKIYGEVPAFTVAGNSNEEAIANWKQSSANSNPAFREWILGHVKNGEIGDAAYHTMKDYAHAVPLLDANETGVYLADSVHGLVWIEWDRFINPFTSREMARIWAWYSVTPKAGNPTQ